MKKELEMIEQEIESLEPGAVVQLDTFTKDIKPKGRKAQIREVAIMLLNKYGIEYKE